MTPAQLRHFEAKVERVTESGCWIWMGSLGRGQYGRLRDGALTRYAHVMSYEHYCGPIGHGLQLDHLCRVPSCVNPSHLEAVAARTNVLRSLGVAAKNASKRHCQRGHELFGANLYAPDRSLNRRNCRICKLAYHREYMRRRRAAIA